MKQLFTAEELDEAYLESVDVLIEELPKLKEFIQCHMEKKEYDVEVDEDTIDMFFPEIKKTEELILELIKCLLCAKYTKFGEGAKFVYKRRVHEISHMFRPYSFGGCTKDELTRKNLEEKLEELYQTALCYCFDWDVPDCLKDTKCPWAIDELMSNLDDFEYKESSSMLDRLPERR